MPVNKKLIWFFIIVSFLGFADATYLTINHLLDTVPPCLLAGCDLVTTSQYATWGPVPVALLGAVFYLVVLLSSLVYKLERWDWSLKLIKYLPWLGLLATLYFTYLQAFVINAWCQYCLFSALTSTLLFVASFWLTSIRQPADSGPATGSPNFS